MAASESRSVEWARDCAAVVPCFNEDTTISAVVCGIREHLPTVFVVDDGSTDGTAKESTAAGATVIRNTANRGKGSALRIGLNHARAQGFKWALTMDGDGQHAATDIQAFFACAEKTGAELVIGNRLTAAEKIPRLRRVVNRLMTRLLSRLTRTPLADSQCGFRLIHLEAWARLSMTTDHFETESETLVQFIRAGHHVAFVPVQVIYQTRRSNIRPLIDTWRWVRWWLRQ